MFVTASGTDGTEDRERDERICKTRHQRDSGTPVSRNMGVPVPTRYVAGPGKQGPGRELPFPEVQGAQTKG